MLPRILSWPAMAARGREEAAMCVALFYNFWPAVEARGRGGTWHRLSPLFLKVGAVHGAWRLW